MKNIDTILKLANQYENSCLQSLDKFARIRKLPGGKYRVLSQKGKNLGTSDTKSKAKKRLKQVEYFKYLDKSKADDKSVIDLTDADEFTYSALMRKLRKNTSPEQLKLFLQLFKSYFDKAVKNKIHKPEKFALLNAILRFSKVHPVRLDKKIVKGAAVSTPLSNAEQVGKYLSDIVRFTLTRIPPDKRAQATERLKQKFSTLNELEIASKQMPMSSALGQSITFVKHVLFNHDANYVRSVLDNLVRNL